MAFTERSGRGYVVKQGNTGRTLRRFRGENAKGRADQHVARLHRRNMPAAINRGARARGRHGVDGSRNQ